MHRDHPSFEVTRAGKESVKSSQVARSSRIFRETGSTRGGYGGVVNNWTRFAIVTALLCLTVPAVSWAQGPPDNQGTQNAATHKKGSDTNEAAPNASLPAKAKAYGRYCQNQSKTHVAGQKGTPFSQCVTAMAKAASGTVASPSTACAGVSKTHVAGQKGTPFSQCKQAAAKLLKDQHKQNS